MQAMALCDFLKNNRHTPHISWEQAEKKLGFCIHQDLKYYTQIINRTYKGYVDFVAEAFIEKTGNERFDSWFCDGHDGYTTYTLEPLGSSIGAICASFDIWTGGNDFGHRAMLGTLQDRRLGQILILFNNDTGKVEWIDCEYGYFDTYEENPNGVLANSLSEFFDKLQTVTLKETKDTQINFWMEYDAFVQVAQAAVSYGCVLIKKTADGKHISGTDISIVSKDAQSYYFYVPEAGAFPVETIHGYEFIAHGASALTVISADYSIVMEGGKEITRGRLYASPEEFGENDYISRPDCVTNIYRKLVELVKKLAPYTEFTGSYISTKEPEFLQEKAWARREFISPQILQQKVKGNYALSLDYAWVKELELMEEEEDEEGFEGNEDFDGIENG